MEFIKRFLRHDAGHVAQFIKYGMAGGLATSTHIAVFFALGWHLLPCLTADDPIFRVLALVGISPTAAPLGDGRGLNAALATAGAFIVSNAVAYILNVLFVFKSGRHHWVKAVAMFYAVSGVSMILGTAMQTVLIERYDLMTSVAFGANLVSALLINYAMRKFFIFKG